MKCGLFFFLYMLLASLSHVMAVGVVVSFDPPVMRCKPLAHSPPICRLKIESKEEVFPYSGSTNLANAILRRIDAGQTVSLSIIGYSSYDQCIGLLAHLNLREVFAYPKGMKVQTWSPFNNMHVGPLDKLSAFPYAEARTRHRCACFQSGLPFHRHGGKTVACDVIGGDVFCISNLLANGISSASGRNTFFFPELDCLVVYSPDDCNSVLAACHFTGGDLFPFEGCARGLPAEMRGIANASFVMVEPEVLLEREFGTGFVGVSGDELTSKIVDSPRRDRMLELIHTRIAENEFGRWNMLGSTFGIVSTDSASQERKCALDIFVSQDRKLVVGTHEKRVVCVWIVYNESFWKWLVGSR